MYELVWFLGGAIIYKFLARLFGLYQATNVFKSLEINILIILTSMTEDIAFIKRTFINHLSAAYSSDRFAS